MPKTLGSYRTQLEALARRAGLDYFPVDFEVVPSSFMMEVAVYGLPIRMPHWSFGVRYIYQLVQHRMGHSRLFEVVFPGNPGRAYLASNNSLEENTLVTAHVLGHADFSKNNYLFRRSQEQVGYHIVEQAAAHARGIADAIEEHGAGRVETTLDAALALEQHIDVDHLWNVRCIRSWSVRRRRPAATSSTSASAGWETARRLRRMPTSRGANAHPFRRIRNTICSGSSPTTPRSSRIGSAICFSRCAPSRSISTRCSPARS